MASYGNCKTGDVMAVGEGYGFNIVSDRNRPLVTLSRDFPIDQRIARSLVV